MQRKSFGDMPCPIARSLERVGEWWSILILRDAFRGLTRFDQFQKSLDIAPNMLTRRLNALVESGLLERRRYSERPPRDEYVLTERGRDFRPVLWALLAWGNKHFAPEGASVVVVDTETGAAGRPGAGRPRAAASRWPSRRSARCRAGRQRAHQARDCRMSDRQPRQSGDDRSAASDRPPVAARRPGGAWLRARQLGSGRRGAAGRRSAPPGTAITGGRSGASSRAPTTPMSAATSR